MLFILFIISNSLITFKLFIILFENICDIINYIYELCISFEFGKFDKRSDNNDIQYFSDKDKRKQKNADKREDIDVVEKWYDRYGYSSIQFIFV